MAISVRSLPRIVGTLLSTRLTLTQVKLLSTIVLAESITLSSLAEQSGVSLPTISKLVDRLSHVKLVERSADPDDQRVRRVRPTPLGRRVMGRIVGPHPALGADVIAGLSVDELRALETGMRAVNRELQRLASS
ncbi:MULTISPECIES: MarR family winged helix-turn-helix transcriptional regulator [unclassified Microbacterium]|uniref:MarR family winged helix-turn-helix transcriptional regulator n=1 Tax=Microbacterium TaxID=33882 RepID=UPI003BA01AFC